MLATIRRPRVGKLADLALLLSDDAAWINSQVWTVNGGGSLRE